MARDTFPGAGIRRKRTPDSRGEAAQAANGGVVRSYRIGAAAGRNFIQSITSSPPDRDRRDETEKTYEADSNAG